MPRVSFPGGDECDLDPKVLEHSKLLQHLVSHCLDDTRPIPLINVAKSTYDHIIALLSRTPDRIVYTDEGIVYNDRLIPLEHEFHVTPEAKECIQAQVRVQESILNSLNKQALLSIGESAMYLDIPYVRDVVCMHLANTFNTMPTAEIKAFISE